MGRVYRSGCNLKGQEKAREGQGRWANHPLRTWRSAGSVYFLNACNRKVEAKLTSIISTSESSSGASGAAPKRPESDMSDFV